MYRKIFLGAVLISMIFSGAGEVFHEIEADETQVHINSTVRLECESNCPVNSWRFSYSLPEGSEILGVEDSIGEISDYTYNGQNLELVTNSGRAREEEYVEMQYRVNRPAETRGGLYSRQLSLSGFEGEETSGALETGNLISGRLTHGFDSFYGESLEFSGEGPVQINFNFGEGYENKYYSFFGEAFSEEKVNGSEEIYEISLGTVGYQQNFERFPVVIYNENYRGQAFEWSAGDYRAGLINLRDDEDIRPVLAHETIHGLNDPLLNWDRTSSDWFEEGVAKHTEELVRKHLYNTEQTDRRPGTLFGDEVSYTDLGEGLTYTVPSRGDREELWSYYQNDQDFMMEWAPRKGNRTFGYAYSELIIKNFLVNGGEISEVYSKVDPGRVIESNSEKQSIYSEHLDLRPCDYEVRERFDECLDDVNNYNYELRSAEPRGNRSGLEVERIEIPEREPSRTSQWALKFNDLINKLVEELERLWKNF